jgi:hypothetical protein
MPVSMQYHACVNKQWHCINKGISSEKENRKNHQKTQAENRQTH